MIDRASGRNTRTYTMQHIRYGCTILQQPDRNNSREDIIYRKGRWVSYLDSVRKEGGDDTVCAGRVVAREILIEGVIYIEVLIEGARGWGMIRTSRTNSRSPYRERHPIVVTSDGIADKPDSLLSSTIKLSTPSMNPTSPSPPPPLPFPPPIR